MGFKEIKRKKKIITYKLWPTGTINHYNSWTKCSYLPFLYLLSDFSNFFLSAYMSVCMLDDHGLTKTISDEIFGMLTHMIIRSVIGYIIFTSLFIKGRCT